MLRFLYGTRPGRVLLKCLTDPALSRVCGSFMDSRFSCFLIGPFIKKNNIDMTQFESDGFHCFNDCFSRHVKPGYRPIEMAEDALISPSDGFLSAYSITGETVLPVKQSEYTIRDLIGDDALAEEFRDGLCLVFRLCVNHYHRYHYFDDGSKGENHFIPGILHTVQPIALRHHPVFVRNAREYTVMETAHFGKAIQVEVGAMLVGKIKNHHGTHTFKRGEEKGTFLYGGSTIILLLKKDAAVLDAPFLNELGTGVEVPVKMGQKIGFRSK
ncbi:MAG: phosphatidylserine decarboxylase [Lachnospiraceae bacterium]|nr:phosphatidylserine decarboxylase [Lachnospiraceae bacterium]